MAGTLLWLGSSHVTGGSIHNSSRVCNEQNVCCLKPSLFQQLEVFQTGEAGPLGFCQIAKFGPNVAHSTTVCAN